MEAAESRRLVVGNHREVDEKGCDGLVEDEYSKEEEDEEMNLGEALNISGAVAPQLTEVTRSEWD